MTSSGCDGEGSSAAYESYTSFESFHQSGPSRRRRKRWRELFDAPLWWAAPIFGTSAANATHIVINVMVVVWFWLCVLMPPDWYDIQLCRIMPAPQLVKVISLAFAVGTTTVLIALLSSLRIYAAQDSHGFIFDEIVDEVRRGNNSELLDRFAWWICLITPWMWVFVSVSLHWMPWLMGIDEYVIFFAIAYPSAITLAPFFSTYGLVLVVWKASLLLAQSFHYEMRHHDDKERNQSAYWKAMTVKFQELHQFMDRAWGLTAQPLYVVLCSFASASASAASLALTIPDAAQRRWLIVFCTLCAALFLGLLVPLAEVTRVCKEAINASVSAHAGLVPDDAVQRYLVLAHNVKHTSAGVNLIFFGSVNYGKLVRAAVALLGVMPAALSTSQSWLAHADTLPYNVTVNATMFLL